MGSTTDIFQLIRNDVIGRNARIGGPFGSHRSFYADHAGSGQSLQCIEDFIRVHVLPYYSNTHGHGTFKSEQTTKYRNASREIIHKAVGASEEDVVLFCGSGSTAAIHKLVHVLIPRLNSSDTPRPVVLLGQFEHHSNILPWRESGAKIILIPETETGVLDINYLEDRLKELNKNKYGNTLRKRRRIIGSFSVVSNVTGIPSDDVTITTLLHIYGALSLWDYSSAAAHVKIFMNPLISCVAADIQSSRRNILANKDAIFFSGHKFVGGPQTPGVLVAKRSVFSRTSPHGVGGGTVLVVTAEAHEYLEKVEDREEGGTPALIESIRLGLAMNLKESITVDAIMTRESDITRKILQDWSKIPEIIVLGPELRNRIPIISFLIEHPPTKYFLHHNYVVTLLNDLFGITARGGCGCAGPYAAELLGIGVELANKYGRKIQREGEGMKPGFTRISLAYYSSDEEVQFISDAVQMIAKHGWKLLSTYEFNTVTGEFCHRQNYGSRFHGLPCINFCLHNIEYEVEENSSVRNGTSQTYENCLREAQIIFDNAKEDCENLSRVSSETPTSAFASSDKLKWCLLPFESRELMRNEETKLMGVKIKSARPFSPKIYLNSKNIEVYAQKSVAYQIYKAK